MRDLLDADIDGVPLDGPKGGVAGEAVTRQFVIVSISISNVRTTVLQNCGRSIGLLNQTQLRPAVISYDDAPFNW
jgi:hypothetical protein